MNETPVLSVSQLSLSLKSCVEQVFAHIKVRGEISDVKRAASGHIYFSLKDQEAVLSAICWRGRAASATGVLQEGLEVICTGKLSTYPGRSNYQMIVETVEPAGVGALLKLLNERREKLAKEGLFDASHKKKIPFLPETIGVITSPTGAVIRDIIHRLTDRFPRSVLVWPVAVQGAECASQVAAAIQGFNKLPAGFPKPDVLIVARGGGSLEDLWGFNEEAVVRAVYDSKIPVISAVGHETDTTLIDYVADLRAPTPTGAAEKAVPLRSDLLRQEQDLSGRLRSSLVRLVQEKRLRLDSFARALPNLTELIPLFIQRLDDSSGRLE
ncbi:MAG: exodeoxyribonuclease VII large subunit, partial [Alphaproteobacteria bacterium]